MFRKLTTLLFMVLALLALTLSVTAQEDAAEETPIRATLEEVTANAGEYYQEDVTIEGVLMEFVNVNSFILGEDVPIDDDRLLVINSSGSYFSGSLFPGARLEVTGTIYPSLTNRNPDEDELPVFQEAEETAEIVFEDVFGLYYDGSFPEAYGEFTVLRISDIESVQYVVVEDAEGDTEGE